MCPFCAPKSALKERFESAKAGIDPADVNRVVKGLPVDNDNTAKIRNLRAAWSQYHTSLRV